MFIAKGRVETGRSLYNCWEGMLFVRRLLTARDYVICILSSCAGLCYWRCHRHPVRFHGMHVPALVLALVLALVHRANASHRIGSDSHVPILPSPCRLAGPSPRTGK